MFEDLSIEDLEAYDEVAEAAEWDESEDYEAAPRKWSPKRRGALPRPKHGNAVAKQVATGYATKAELTATANRLDGRIAVNTKAIGGVSDQIKSLGASHNRLEAHIKKEHAHRKAQTDGLRASVENMKMAVMLGPLISAPKTVDMGGQKVLVDDGDNFGKLLPLLLMSGSFGGSQPGSTTSSNDMMMPLLILAMAK